jgi:quinolinate synthase
MEPDMIQHYKDNNPGYTVVCYINTTAALKTICDVCVTSSSAVKIVKRIENNRILFIPDCNLGDYVSKQVPEKEIKLLQGGCPIHAAVNPDEVDKAKALHPDALLLVHPECRPGVLALSDFIGSTAEILKYVEQSPEKDFIIGTETGVVERLRQTAPDKNVYLLTNCLFCPNMKKTRLSDVLYSLENGVYEINLPEKELRGALTCLQRMVAVQ